MKTALKLTSQHSLSPLLQFSFYSPNSFFTANENGELVKISNNQRNFTALFPNKQEQVSKYIKENKLTLNNENDLTKVFKFINN